MVELLLSGLPVDVCVGLGVAVGALSPLVLGITIVIRIVLTNSNTTMSSNHALQT